MQTWLVLALDRSVIIGGDTEIGVLDAFLIVDGVRFTLGAIGEGEPTLFREVLRLRHALGVSERQIAVTTGLSRSTVSEYLRRAAVIGITWPVPDGLDDAELERRLFTPPTAAVPNRRFRGKADFSFRLGRHIRRMSLDILTT